MKFLRLSHVVLSCLFAPMLVFFTVSGVWQMLGWHDKGEGSKGEVYRTLSTVHLAHGEEAGEEGRDLSSPGMRVFVYAMAAGFLLTTLLGIVLVLKLPQQRRLGVACLVLGLLIPVALAWMAGTH